MAGRDGIDGAFGGQIIKMGNWALKTGSEVCDSGNLLKTFGANMH
jgi:hypothetical protein